MIAIYTADSVYRLDTAAKTITRTTTDGEPLRRDGEPIPLYRWPEIRLGRPVVLLLMVREDGVPTVRMTEPVTRVESREG